MGNMEIILTVLGSLGLLIATGLVAELEAGLALGLEAEGLCGLWQLAQSDATPTAQINFCHPWLRGPIAEWE